MVYFYSRSLTYPVFVGPFPSNQLSITSSLAKLRIVFPCTMNGFIYEPTVYNEASQRSSTLNLQLLGCFKARYHPVREELREFQTSLGNLSSKVF